VSLPPVQALLDAHGRDVHRFLIAIVGRDDADDCYQDTWLAAMRAYPRLTDAGHLRGWIFTVAHRKALDRIRARRRAPVAVATLPEAGAPDAGALPGALADGDLWKAVRELPAKQRTAVALRFVADAAYGEISTAMGTSEEAARRNVHEGLKRLRREYQP
jgi:RNA polymerase sigma factor (sigma-70 family)